MKHNKLLKALGALTIMLGTALVLTGCSSSSTSTNNQSTDVGSAYISDGSFTVGKSGAIKTKDIKKKATVDVYFDPLCPSCGEFERQTGSYLSKQVKSGNINVKYHPLMFLNQGSTDQYSSRASGFILAVAANAPKLAQKYVSAIYEKSFQPEEGDDYVSVSNEKLGKLFLGVGGTKSELKKIKKSQSHFAKVSYDTTVKVMKDKALIKKSPTGELFTPFIIPNKAGSTSGEALSFEKNMLPPTKEAVKNIIK